MRKLAMAITMLALAAAPVIAQQAEQETQADHAHQCPHHHAAHQGAHQGGDHAMGQHRMGAHGTGQHQMGAHHEAMQEMHAVMMMMHHPAMLDLSEAQVERLAALRDRVHADGTTPMQRGPEAMKELAEEARGILTAEQRERLAEMNHPMGEECPMMQHGEQGHH